MCKVSTTETKERNHMGKEIINEFNNLTNDELKEEFLKYFTEEQWNQEEELSKLWPVQLALSDLLGVEPIPVVVEDIEEDSRFYTKDLYISISEKLIGNEVEALKCLIHEYKHYQQYMCIIYNMTEVPFYKKWKEEFEIKDIKDLTYEEIICQSVEIDATAFAKYILKEWFDIEINHPDPLYNKVLQHYIKNYF